MQLLTTINNWKLLSLNFQIKKHHGEKKWQMYWLVVARVSSAVEFVMPFTKKAMQSTSYHVIQHAPKVKLHSAKAVYGWNPETEKLPIEPHQIRMPSSIWWAKLLPVDGTLKRNGKYGTVGFSPHGTLIASLDEADPKPETLVCASAIGYYGGSDASLTEASPPGTDYLAEVCAEWEAEALKASEFGIRVVLVRIGLVLGLGGGLLQQVLPPFKMGIGGVLGNGRQWMSWVHIDDVVGILLHALESSQIHGPLKRHRPDTS